MDYCKISKSTLTIQIFTVCVIILSYFTSRFINLVAAIICALYLISNTTWEQRYSLFYFIFPFATVFSFQEGQTSLFIFLRLAIILSVLIYDIKKIDVNFFIRAVVFVLYCIVVSAGNEMEFLKRLLNIILWILIVYVMQGTVSGKNSLPISRSISNGVIIASVVGLNIDSIPGMKFGLMHQNLYLTTGEVTNRFNGLSGDPNFYTILVCVSLWAIFYEFSNKKITNTEFIVRNAICTLFGALTFSKSCVLIVAFFWICVLLLRSNMKIFSRFMVAAVISGAIIYFLYTNPEWFDTMFYRFTRGESGRVSVNALTTGRFEIWGYYLSYMYTTASWVWGNGLAALMPHGMASHNLILQCLYSIGFVGMLYYFSFFKKAYRNMPIQQKVSVDKIGFLAIVSICAMAFFLDFLHIEDFYYATSLALIFMKKPVENVEISETQQMNIIQQM